MRRIALWTVIAGLLAAIALAADAPLGKIAYGVKEGDRVLIHVMNADGTGDKILPGQTAAYNLVPAWSPDGKRLAYTATEQVQGDAPSLIVVVNADGSDSKTYAPGFESAVLATWSPDGKMLAFMGGGAEAGRGIYVMDTLGNRLQRISPEEKAAFTPFWYDGGKKVGYFQIDPQMMEGALVLVNPDGSEEREITTLSGLSLTGPGGLSPDGKRLIYASIDPENNTAELHIWDFANQSDSVLSDIEVDVNLGEDPSGIPLASWSPDGASFIVPLKTEAGPALFRVSADGKMKTQLTPNGVVATAGSWWAPPK